MWLLSSSNKSFPPTNTASEEGILAIGGDLSIDRLMNAYEAGIFPWYEEGSEILWWAPDPRFVLFINELKVSKSMRQFLRNTSLKVTLDTAFDQVIRACKTVPRKGQEGTWITDEMEEAYIALHEEGYAHSVEVWDGDKLVGGLYGVSIGHLFFGESMFNYVSNASKMALISLADWLKGKGFAMIDCQDYTDHVASLGAREISRVDFERILTKELKHASIPGPWRL